MSYHTFHLEIENYIADLRFARPDKANALNEQAWQEMEAIFKELDQREDVRVVVLSGEGKHFCSGIDLSLLMSLGQAQRQDCEGRKREEIRRHVKALQAPIEAMAACRKPVLAAVHNGCIGAGLDILSATDMRYCSADAWFCVKEIDMGMVADLGTLQRLPRLIPEGLARELAFTGRKMSAQEAVNAGLVNRSYADREEMLREVKGLASLIAEKSPLSIRGIKEVMNYGQDHSIADGLEYIATWNAAMILSDDLGKAFQAAMSKQKAVFID